MDGDSPLGSAASSGASTYVSAATVPGCQVCLLSAPSNPNITCKNLPAGQRMPAWPAARCDMVPPQQNSVLGGAALAALPCVQLRWQPARLQGDHVAVQRTKMHVVARTLQDESPATSRLAVATCGPCGGPTRHRHILEDTAPATQVLPRADVLVIGGDLAYPNPSNATYEKRLFRCRHGSLMAAVFKCRLLLRHTMHLCQRLLAAPLPRAAKCKAASFQGLMEDCTTAAGRLRPRCRRRRTCTRGGSSRISRTSHTCMSARDPATAADATGVLCCGPQVSMRKIA